MPGKVPVSAGSGERAAKTRDIGDDGFAKETQRRHRPVASVPVAEAAGIFDHHRHEAIVGRLPDRRLDADFHRHSGERDGAHAAIVQGEAERGGIEGRHGQLVEHGFVGAWRELGNDLRGFGIAQEPRLDHVGAVAPLPGHGGAQLGCAHPFASAGTNGA